MMRRLFGAMGLVGVLLVAAPTADAATRLTKIQRPGADQVVGTGKSVRVVVRSRASLDALTITVDGRNVTRSFRRSDGAYRATLRPGQLHAGENQLTVKTRNYKDFDHRTFLVARRVPNLLKLTDLDVAGPSAPVRAEVRVRRDAELDAWVNGRRVDHAFQPAGRSYVGRLGANDGVRPGRNRLVVLVSREVRSGRRAVHDVEETTFRLKPRQVVAGAGRDQVVDAGDPIELRGRAAGADGDVAYGWEIVDAPEGGDGAAIRDADTATPVFVPTAPGVYRLRATVRAARDASAGRVAQVTSSSDTMTVFARTDLPPIGWPLAVGTDNRGTIALDGKPVPDTTKCADPATAAMCAAVHHLRGARALVPQGQGVGDPVLRLAHGRHRGPDRDREAELGRPRLSDGRQLLDLDARQCQLGGSDGRARRRELERRPRPGERGSGVDRRRPGRAAGLGVCRGPVLRSAAAEACRRPPRGSTRTSA